ncbi:MAG: 3-deoxy-D-manno-octulosonic acid transferase [Bacteroidia bacterium]|nr:3-deoxy-D-manno-octulosonic acid transferase [Bacteroidia bacterium]
MFLYNLVIYLYGLVIKLASINKLKAKQWVTGRKNWRENLCKKIAMLNSGNVLWVHCASYGEFEQGRPLIEAIKKEHPGYKIVLSFFSPSGYEAFKDWRGADLICYLPLDTKKNARDFISIVKPKASIFIKYEFWLNFLFELKKHNIPTYLVSAVFKPHHPFFRWYGGIFRRSLNTFNKLFIQDEASGKLLEKIDIKNYEVCGDTRFDRVIEVKENFKEIEQLKDFKGNKKLIIAGSTWAKDEELVLKTFLQLKDKKIKLVIVPHDIDEKYVNETVHKVKTAGLTFSLFTDKINNDDEVLIVNVMGLLSKIYFYADCSYIGGGFNSGLHNSLEPAVYGKPVTFYGKDYVKFNEAVDLINMGAAKVVEDETDLLKTFNLFLSDTFDHHQLTNKLQAYFKTNSNTTNKVLPSIKF